MELWKDFEEAKNVLFSFINGKQVILWGYDYNAYFLEHLFRLSNKNIEYIVDDGSMNPRLRITRSCELLDFSPDIYAVIITKAYDSLLENYLQHNGFHKNINYVYAKDVFLRQTNEERQSENISYFGYLENRYDIDIIDRKSMELMEVPHEDCLCYAPGIGYGLADVLEQFSFDSEDSVFDFGCGKGGALILFEKYGLKQYGGVEYDKQLYSVLCDNFDKLGLNKALLINGDARLITTELDQYNYFFMYNPFQGETFSQVIYNIEKSWYRNIRRIVLIYSGPYCHNEVIKHGLFKLTKKIYTDYAVRNVNIYMIPDNAAGDRCQE